MTKIDVVSGFLGAGKTTLIKKLLKEALDGSKTVLIENEFGEIGIDGGFLKESGIEIKEMNSGCICCSLVGDFSERSDRDVCAGAYFDRALRGGEALRCAEGDRKSSRRSGCTDQQRGCSGGCLQVQNVS